MVVPRSTRATSVCCAAAVTAARALLSGQNGGEGAGWAKLKKNLLSVTALGSQGEFVSWQRKKWQQPWQPRHLIKPARGPIGRRSERLLRAARPRFARWRVDIPSRTKRSENRLDPRPGSAHPAPLRCGAGQIYHLP